jgi:hypothetical protein
MFISKMGDNIAAATLWKSDAKQVMMGRVDKLSLKK